MESSWLEIGFGLWSQIEPAGRGFFMPRPATHSQGLQLKVASAADAGCLSRQLFVELKNPVLEVGGHGLALETFG